MVLRSMSHCSDGFTLSMGENVDTKIQKIGDSIKLVRVVEVILFGYIQIWRWRLLSVLPLGGFLLTP